MELMQLVQFKAAAEEGNITKAAEKLYLSQPALTLSIKKLEKELGVELFDRKKNSVKLNDAGKYVLEEVNGILGTISRMESGLEQFRANKKKRTIRFFTSVQGALRYFMPIFNSISPDMFFNGDLINFSEARGMLTSGQADIVITAREIKSKDIMTIPLCQELLCLCVAEGDTLYDREKVSLADLDGRDLLWTDLNPPGDLNEIILECFNKKGVKPALFRQSDYGVIMVMRRSTNMLFTLSNISRTYVDIDETRKCIYFSDPEMRFTYYISYLKENSKKMKSVLDWLHVHYSEFLI